MNPLVENIKNALHSGHWKDASGVIHQINKGNVTFKELIDGGALDKNVFSKIAFDDAFLLERLKTENIAIEKFELLLPDAQYKKLWARINEEKMRESEAALEEERKKTAEERKRHLQAIRNNAYTPEQIKTLIDNRVLTRIDIIRDTHLSEEEVAEIMGDPVENLLPPPLPPSGPQDILLENRTDVFTFGVVGSGKSLFLGALFTYAEQLGLYRTDQAHKAATLYTDFLIKAIKKGRPIEGTAVDYALYLPVTFKNKEEHIVKKTLFGAVKKQKFHPFNFIEMSGEHFQDIYMSQKDNIFQWLKDYLFSSKNKKIFFFAIDYFIHKSNSEDMLQASQSAQFTNVLNFLQQNDLMKDTISICLLITKWDLCTSPSETAAIDFLEKNYRNLFETCKDLKRDNKNLDFKIFTFSIGDVKKSNAYKFNPAKSAGIFEWLCDTSYYVLKD